MRKIEQQLVNALRNGQTFKSGNTQVKAISDPGEPVNLGVHLHGHYIASWCPETETLTIRDAGWQSVTTKSRLNALLSTFAPAFGIRQANFKWLLLVWNGTAFNVRDWSGSAGFKNNQLLWS